METTTPEIEKIVGHSFRNRALLEEALTHRSRAQESSTPLHNERLEFLGDAVLGLIVGERLVEIYPSASEGQLTKLKGYIVSAANLVEVGRALELGKFLRLGRGEDLSGGREKKTLLVDGLEALLAAIYLDGGIAAAQRFCRQHILTETALAAAAGHSEAGNFKSALQEWLQQRRLPTPSYDVVRQSGPAHARRFHIELRVGTLFTSRAEGPTKKSAEQAAAQAALDHFQQEALASRDEQIVETPDTGRP
jgi:ribonuclease III